MNGRETGRNSLLISLLFTMITISFVERAFGPLIPFVRDELNLSEIQVALSSSAILLGSLMGVIPLGILLGRIHSSISIPIGLLILSIVCVLVGLQSTFLGFVLGISGLGLVRSGMVPVVNKVVADRFSRLRRGSVLGVILFGGPLGGMVAGLLLPVMASNYGWQAGFLFLAVIAFLSALFSRISLRSSRDLIEGIPQSRRLAIQGYWKNIAWIGSAFFCLAMGIYATSSFITLFLVDQLKIGHIWAGSIFGLSQVGSAFGRLLWGKLADGTYRYRGDRLLVLIALASSISLCLITLLDQETPLFIVGIIILLIGMTSFASWVVLFILISDVFGQARTASATSIIMAVGWGGGIGGSLMFGIILTHTRSYNISFLSLAALALFSAIIFYRFPNGGRLIH